MADLTDKQKVLVANSWDIVKKDFKANSVAFFLFFFKTHPEHQEKFAKFRGKTADEIKDSIPLKSHASRVFHAVSSLIDNLDDLPIVVDIMEKTVTDHWPRGIKAGEFQDLFNTIVAFLAMALKEEFCEETKTGWINVATILMGVITAQLEKLDE